MDDEYEGFCIDCDRIVPLIFKRRKVEQTEKGISFSYPEDYAICTHCGNKVYVPRLNDKNAKVRASAYFEEKEKQHVKEAQMQSSYAIYAYLCNTHKCEHCSFPECSHTTDESYRLISRNPTEMRLVGSTDDTKYYMEYVIREKNNAEA